jgi:hypothetical protein
MRALTLTKPNKIGEVRIMANRQGLVGNSYKEKLAEAREHSAILVSLDMMKSYIRDYEMGQESIGKFLDLMRAKIELLEDWPTPKRELKEIVKKYQSRWGCTIAKAAAAVRYEIESLTIDEFKNVEIIELITK